MRGFLPTELLLKLINATPDQLMAVQRILSAVPGAMATTSDGARRSFARCGDHWKVIFDGHELHLNHSLGAQYLDFLLHHPNQPISAFDLELAIAPEKKSARAVNSCDSAADAETTRRVLRELNRLRSERNAAVDAGDDGRAIHLDADIAAFEAQLNRGRRAHDTGERARNNVRKAIAVVLRTLQRGDAAQKNFAAHLNQFVNTGYECIYHQPPGVDWA